MKDEAVAAAAAAGTDGPMTSDYVSSNLYSTGSQTDMTGDFIEAMTSEFPSLRTENIHLRSDAAKLSTSYDQSATFLSYAFNISVTTASRIVTDVMFIRQSHLSYGQKGSICKKKNMPMQFRKHYGEKICCYY